MKESNNQNFQKRGFTLIELLIVISIVGVIIALSIFGLRGARESARDSKRKTDLETIRSSLEFYKSDCGTYPTALTTPLAGDDSLPNCLSTNVYLQEVPQDPTSPQRDYLYSSDGVTYELCASLEQITGTSVTCGISTDCGETCNYKVTNP